WAPLAHEVVILTCSPRLAVWREVNRLRALAGCRRYRVLPRFALDDGLKPVPGPYDPPSAVHADNPSGLGPRLREHLRRYDRFYVPWMYDPPRGLARHSVLAKLVLARWHARLMRRLHEDALDPRSEAVAVSAGIVQAMRADAA